MISLKEIKQKAERPWTSGRFLKSWLAEEEYFPLDIPFRKPSGRSLGSDFAKVRDWMALLHKNSKDVCGTGFSIEYRAINHQQLGRQRIPDTILFENRDDWLSYIGKRKAFRQFDEIVGSTRRQLPEVMEYLKTKPLKVLEYAESWASLLKVCRYFQHNPNPGRYIRQLDIQGVDTKFIEGHKGILSELLVLALDSDDFDGTVIGLAENGFERRFGLLYDEPLVRFRLLESDHDMSVPISRFVDPGVQRVFITENKVNGLAFPKVRDAMVIFGLGYGIRSLATVSWLKDKELVYWGDIDTHGFAILSQVRKMFPGTRSLMMDETTLREHLSLCVLEQGAKRFLGELPDLSTEESALFESLKDNRLGRNLRLEQERIRYSWVLKALD